ncbi:MAG: hypothetical protein MJK04_35535, partial [Psychrosphaera sp.]|nr:hypothetical protein [Psychrosphaera sp.]
MNRLRAPMGAFFIGSVLLLLNACSEPLPKLTPVFTQQYANEPLLDAQLSKDATLSAMLSVSQNVLLIDNQSQKQIHHWDSDKFDFQVDFLALSANKTVLGTAGENSVIIWDTQTGKSVARWQVKGFDQDSKISAFFISKSGEIVLVGMTEGSVLTFDLKNSKQSMFAIHDGTVKKLMLTDDGHNIVSGGTDGVVAYWQTLDGKIIQSLEQRFRITALAIDETSQRLFISDALGEQYVWDLVKQQRVTELDYFERWRWFREAVFVPGDRVITSSPKREITLWDINTGKALKLSQIKGLS